MPNFYAAAKRHFDDGDHLNATSRVPSAVQLWAYGAECTLKAIAQKQGHFSLTATGKPTSGFDIHLDKLDAVNQQRLLSLYNAKQTGPNAIVGPSSAFPAWTIAARYEDGGQLQPVSFYSGDVAIFRSMLVSALAQGLLP